MNGTKRDHYEWFRELLAKRAESRRRYLLSTTPEEISQDSLLQCYDSREYFERHFPDAIQRENMLELFEERIAQMYLPTHNQRAR